MNRKTLVTYYSNRCSTASITKEIIEATNATGRELIVHLHNYTWFSTASSVKLYLKYKYKKYVYINNIFNKHNIPFLLHILYNLLIYVVSIVIKNI
jgi:hypothetical protein